MTYVASYLLSSSFLLSNSAHFYFPQATPSFHAQGCSSIKDFKILRICFHFHHSPLSFSSCTYSHQLFDSCFLYWSLNPGIDLLLFFSSASSHILLFYLSLIWFDHLWFLPSFQFQRILNTNLYSNSTFQLSSSSSVIYSLLFSLLCKFFPQSIPCFQ